jgi:hypothetical protein
VETKEYARLLFCVTSAVLLVRPHCGAKRCIDFFSLASNRVQFHQVFFSQYMSLWILLFSSTDPVERNFLAIMWIFFFYSALHSQVTSHETVYCISSVKNDVQRYRIWIISVRHSISLLNTISWQCGLYLCLYPLRPSGNYMNHLLWQSVMLHFAFIGFCMVLTANSDYFLKQH